MATVKQAGVKRLKMSERAEQQLELHFPNYHKLWVWERKVHHGYTTLPRTLPYAMQAIDDQSKGQPAGHTLFCLWTRSPDHPLVIIENPVVLAAEAGFSGERAVDTWRRRMKRLQELNFIAVKKGSAGDFNYVLLLNPNVAMEHMHQSGLVQTDLFGRFLTRLTDVGGFSEIQAIRAEWDALRATQAAQALQSVAAPPSSTAGPSPVVTLTDASLSASTLLPTPRPAPAPANTLPGTFVAPFSPVLEPPIQAIISSQGTP